MYVMHSDIILHARYKHMKQTSINYKHLQSVQVLYQPTDRMHDEEHFCAHIHIHA